LVTVGNAEGVLEPHGLRSGDAHVAGHALVVQAADDARLEVHGRRRHAEPLLRQARAERDTRCRHHGSAVRFTLDVPVDLRHGRQNRASRDDFKSFPGVPQVGIGDRLARLLESPDRQKFQSLGFDQLLKERIGEHRGSMAAGLERETECDDRVHVACASQRGEKDLQRRWRHQRTAGGAADADSRTAEPARAGGSAAGAECQCSGGTIFG
jgi:hypothetical protein